VLVYRIHALIWPARNPILHKHTRRPAASCWACCGADRIAVSAQTLDQGAEWQHKSAEETIAMLGRRSLGVTEIDSADEIMLHSS
jgi:hypothetical protein